MKLDFSLKQNAHIPQKYVNIQVSIFNHSSWKGTSANYSEFPLTHRERDIVTIIPNPRWRTGFTSFIQQFTHKLCHKRKKTKQNPRGCRISTLTQCHASLHPLVVLPSVAPGAKSWLAPPPPPLSPTKFSYTNKNVLNLLNSPYFLFLICYLNYLSI